MSKLKVAELFYSIQGEGKYTGVPSVFLRLFGCNFQCPSFGLPKGQKTTEVESIAQNVHLYKTYEELPLVSTGCDSYASWHPAFKHLSPTLTSDEVVDKIMDMLPHHRWKEEHLVITGGEPLLGWQRAYPDLLSHPRMQKLKELTFETNGTQPLTEEFKNYLSSWVAARGYDKLTFSVSPKLSCSGHTHQEAILPEIVSEYAKVGNTYLKFVVATDQDAQEALDAVDLYRTTGFKGPVYLMGVGGTEEVFFKTNRQVAELAMKHGLRYSDRLQVGLFRNAWGT